MRVAIVGSRPPKVNGARWLGNVHRDFMYRWAASDMSRMYLRVDDGEDNLDHQTITTLVSGGAIGVDLIAETVARNTKTKCLIFKPQWDKLGKRAGFERNKRIVEAAEVVVAFWDGESKGTQHTINLALAAGKPTYILVWNNDHKKFVTCRTIEGAQQWVTKPQS